MQSGGDTATPGKKVSARFQKASRLLKHADFDRVYRQGKRHFSANLTVFWAKRQPASARTGGPQSSGQPSGGPQDGAHPGPRIGFTVGKVLGGAVVRNRIKRRLREAVRLSLPGFATAVDVVINPKKSALTAEMPKLTQEIGAALAAIGKNSPPRPQKDTRA